ncbi:RNA 3'-terminal phosphate cyclase/enolpyruvate transferase [Lactarius quietus]|nr:RNA 3'-terminal phosphate cyclase/enolpyruvate transferase [Lactarius quietus]
MTVGLTVLRLIEKVTNGTMIEISLTGTAILIKPRIIAGGPVTHECPTSHSIGYFLEPIIMLAPFSKMLPSLMLRGITSDDNNLSVCPPHITLVLSFSLLSLRLINLLRTIKKWGSPPLGGGEVFFVEPGRVKHIRGIVYAVCVSPQFSNRMIEAARSVLNRYIPDIYLYSDIYKGEESRKSLGYALLLVMETTTSTLHCAECCSQAAQSLLTKIERGRCVDQKHQTLILLMMALGREDIGHCRMAEPTEQIVQFLRDVRDTFGISFKIVPADKSGGSCWLLYLCYGLGYMNTNWTIA